MISQVDWFINYFNNNYTDPRIKILKYEGNKLDNRAVILFDICSANNKTLCLDVAYIYREGCLLELFYRTASCFNNVSNMDYTTDANIRGKVNIEDRDYKYSFNSSVLYNRLSHSWYDLTSRNGFNVYGLGKIVVSCAQLSDANQNIVNDNNRSYPYFSQVIDILQEIQDGNI